MVKLQVILEGKTGGKETEIVTVHHGSNSHVQTFDPSYLDGGHDQKGPGLYTTNDEEESHTYGKHHHTMRVDPSNFIHPNMKPNKAVIRDMVHSSPHFEDAVSNWHENPKIGAKMLVDACANTSSMHDSMERVWYDAYNHDNHSFLEQASMHYHGTIVHPNKFRPSVKHYIVWNGRAIKSIHHEDTEK